MGRKILGERRLHHGARRQRGRRRARFFCRERIRYAPTIPTMPRPKARLPLLPRRASELGTAVLLVGHAVLPTPMAGRAVLATRPHRSASAAEDLHRPTALAPSKSSVHSRPPLKKRLDARCVQRHRGPRRVRLFDALATKARVFRPGPSPTPTCSSYPVDVFHGDDAAE